MVSSTVYASVNVLFFGGFLCLCALKVGACKVVCSFGCVRACTCVQLHVNPKSDVSDLFVSVNAQHRPQHQNRVMPREQRTDGVKSGEHGKALWRVFLALWEDAYVTVVTEPLPLCGSNNRDNKTKITNGGEELSR